MGKSPEELKKIRSEAAKKAAITRKQNKIAAEEKKQQEQQKKTNSSKWDWLLWLLLVLAIVALLIWKKPWTSKAAPTEAPIVETEVPIVETEVPVVETEVPIVETEVPIVATKAPIYQILVGDEIVGVPLDNGAVAITTGRILTGHDAPYSTDELKIIETTAVTFRVDNGSGMTVAFGYTVENHTGGVIQYMGTDSLEITIINGELVIWPSFDLMVADISNRIPDEIQNGNADFDVLAFHWISREFRGFVADSLITARGVQILP